DSPVFVKLLHPPARSLPENAEQRVALDLDNGYVQSETTGSGRSFETDESPTDDHDGTALAESFGDSCRVLGVTQCEDVVEVLTRNAKASRPAPGCEKNRVGSNRVSIPEDDAPTRSVESRYFRAELEVDVE